MSAAIQPAQTPRDRLLESILDQLAPMYAQMYNDDMGLARQAARDAMDSYVQDERADLFVAGQIVACGLTSMRIFQNCMREDVNEPELARLTRTADTLSRTAQRHRVSGLYPPAAPKPAASRAPTLRVVSSQEPPPPAAEPEPAPEAEAPPQTASLTGDGDTGIGRAAILSGDFPDPALRDRFPALSQEAGQPPEDYIFSTTGMPSSPK